MIAQSLAEGPAGAALLALERGDDARSWLAAILAEPIMAHPDDASLFEGAPAVAFTLTATGPSRALTTLDAHVEAITRSRLEAAHRRIHSGRPPAKREFDLVAGLTGLGVYLLHRHGDSDLLRDVITYLVRLTETGADGLPGWWALDGPTGPGPEWSGGHGNLGMAHGIAGPLALLSLALRRGIRVHGQTDAVRRICRWLDRFRCGHAPHVWWPGAITRSEHDHGDAARSGPHRPSWCYGTPGIARAQQLAGLALGDSHRQCLAETALAWCATDEAQLTQLSDASLCHGWAGLLHTVWRAGVHNERLRAAVPHLLDGLADSLLRQPTPGLLVGETGALLAQHAATTNTQPVTQWDTCLLLND
ncbi:lanthionine synthetase C family protein [Haloechinothrix halophila]|uniref:lanthionine synthetase C family protein n=1 Tax=Haloechinothrix halophila TaxID=1069073 RepID=UPI000409387D|nr:lanthionine synthetase C family protein [Haloechinothrix halophila]